MNTQNYGVKIPNETDSNYFYSNAFSHELGHYLTETRHFITTKHGIKLIKFYEDNEERILKLFPLIKVYKGENRVKEFLVHGIAMWSAKNNENYAKGKINQQDWEKDNDIFDFIKSFEDYLTSIYERQGVGYGY